MGFGGLGILLRFQNESELIHDYGNPVLVMPGSSSAGREEALRMLFKIDPEPKTILDVGPGRGQWYDLLKPWYPDAIFFGVEIFEPYVRRYGLDDKYDFIWIDDVRTFARDIDKLFDLVIFGDVIEHMTRTDAIYCVNRLCSSRALISIPIGECPQDPTEENPYEAHLATWETEEVLATFPVIDHYAYKFPPPHYGRGVFLLEKP